MDYETVKKDPQERVTTSGDSLIQQQGYIVNLAIKDRGEKDNLYKFQIKHSSGSITDEWYSGFGNPPGKDGDHINFKYKDKDEYHNVKEILEVKSTHETTSEKDVGDLKTVKGEIEEPVLNSDYGGDNATISDKVPSEELTRPYRALLLNGTIHLCSRRGTLSDEEIKAQYLRFIKLLDG